MQPKTRTSTFRQSNRIMYPRHMKLETSATQTQTQTQTMSDNHNIVWHIQPRHTEMIMNDIPVPKTHSSRGGFPSLPQSIPTPSRLSAIPIMLITRQAIPVAKIINDVEQPHIANDPKVKSWLLLLGMLEENVCILQYVLCILYVALEFNRRPN